MWWFLKSFWDLNNAMKGYLTLSRTCTCHTSNTFILVGGDLVSLLGMPSVYSCSSHNKIKDLFSLVNQCPAKRFGRTMTNQRKERIDSICLLRNYFQALFWKSRSASRELPGKQRRKTSLLFPSTGHSSMDDLH